MTKKMLNYKTNYYFNNLPYHNIIKYDMGSEQEVKQAYKDGYHECEKMLTKAKELLQYFISMDLFQIAENDQDYNAIEQAEQFLKEE